MGDMEPLNYRIHRFSTRERIDALPIYELAHAYSRAWQFVYGTDPQGRHVIGGLDLVIEFPVPSAGERR